MAVEAYYASLTARQRVVCWSSYTETWDLFVDVVTLDRVLANNPTARLTVKYLTEELFSVVCDTATYGLFTETDDCEYTYQSRGIVPTAELPHALDAVRAWAQMFIPFHVTGPLYAQPLAGNPELSRLFAPASGWGPTVPVSLVQGSANRAFHKALQYRYVVVTNSMYPLPGVTYITQADVPMVLAMSDTVDLTVVLKTAGTTHQSEIVQCDQDDFPLHCELVALGDGEIITYTEVTNTLVYRLPEPLVIYDAHLYAVVKINLTDRKRLYTFTKAYRDLFIESYYVKVNPDHYEIHIPIDHAAHYTAFIRKWNAAVASCPTVGRFYAVETWSHAIAARFYQAAPDEHFVFVVNHNVVTQTGYVLLRRSVDQVTVRPYLKRTFDASGLYDDTDLATFESVDDLPDDTVSKGTLWNNRYYNHGDLRRHLYDPFSREPIPYTAVHTNIVSLWNNVGMGLVIDDRLELMTDITVRVTNTNRLLFTTFTPDHRIIVSVPQWLADAVDADGKLDFDVYLPRPSILYANAVNGYPLNFKPNHNVNRGSMGEKYYNWRKALRAAPTPV